MPHWLQPLELGGSLNPLPTKSFSNRGSPWAAWRSFSRGFLLTSSVGVVIVVFDPRS